MKNVALKQGKIIINDNKIDNTDHITCGIVHLIKKCKHTAKATPPYSRDLLHDKVTPDWSIRETRGTGGDGGPAQ